MGDQFVIAPQCRHVTNPACVENLSVAGRRNRRHSYCDFGWIPSTAKSIDESAMFTESGQPDKRENDYPRQSDG